MDCPPEVRTVLCEIIRTGLLRARAAGWAGEAERGAAEADHVHNLPDLVAHFAPDRLRYYREVEAPAYADRWPAGRTVFQPLWDRLDTAAGVRATAGGRPVTGSPVP